MHTDPNEWFQFRKKEPENLRLRVAILTSWDLPRLKRAIQSLKKQEEPVPFWVEINSQNEQYITQAINLCKRLRVNCAISQSTGRAGVGKQAVFNRFNERFDEQFLYLLDGDDWLYPCATQSLLQTIHQHYSIDVMTHLPLDMIRSEYGPHIIAEGAYAAFWPDTCQYPDPVLIGYGAGPAEWLWNDQPQVVGPGRTCLFSRLATSGLKWHPEIGCYEDTHLLLQALAAHQRSEMVAATSMVQDVFIYDLTTPEGGQKKNDLLLASRQLREEAINLVPRDRSSVGELPLIYQPQRITFDDKIAYAVETYLPKTKKG